MSEVISNSVNLAGQGGNPVRVRPRCAFDHDAARKNDLNAEAGFLVGFVGAIIHHWYELVPKFARYSAVVLL